MTFSRLLLGLFISTLVSSCGGGGDVSPGPTGDPNALIYVSKIGLSTGLDYAFSGTTVQFVGGVCGGGYGRLSTMWTYGDGASGTSSSHYYSSPGNPVTVRVTCTDASNNDKKYGITQFDFTVAP